jgi:cytochrome P450
MARRINVEKELARIDKIIEAIEDIPRGPLLTPGELADKRTAEVIAKILGVPQQDDDVRPRWAATEHSEPPWKEETTSADDQDSD